MQSEPGASAGSARLRLQLFGSFKLTGPDGSSLTIANRRGRGLLAYLCCMRDQGASRGRLGGLLWSDREDERARANLRQCLLEVRSDLGPSGVELLEIGRERVALKPGAYEADLLALDEALETEDDEAVTSALDEIGDDALLEDLSLGGLFDEWLEQTRTRVDERIARGVRTLLRRLEAAGSWLKVRDEAEICLRRLPVDETVVASAMRADIALGSQSSAHRRFQVLKDALARDYGVAPGAEATQVLEALKSPGGSDQRSPQGEQAARQPRPAPQAPPLVVVAEFEHAQLGAGDAHIMQAIREEVVSGLSRFHDMCIITDPQPLSTASEETWAERGAAYVLGASFRPGVEGLRQSIRLLRISDRRVVWSDALTLPNRELASAIDRTIAKVVGAVLPTIDSDLAAGGRIPAGDAYLRYLGARAAASEARELAEAQAAVRQLEELIEAYPAFALPYLPLARLYNTDFNYTCAGASGPDERARAFDLAKAALAIDRGHARGYTVTGWCHLRRGDWSAAQAHFDQAVALNPFHADCIMEAGFGQIFLGRLDQAHALLDRCILLNPTPKDMFFMDLGLLELVAGDHDRAGSYFALVARPTIWDVIYRAVNAALGGRLTPADAFGAREAIGAIWPAGQPPSVDDQLAWLVRHNPFCDTEVRERFLKGARIALS
jgi:DNA-binding SARP family transcriptional activator/tetratricopeptide (TPR) repeat protein